VTPHLIVCQILRGPINIRFILPSLPTATSCRALTATGYVSLASTSASGLVLHLADAFGEGGSFAGAVDACGDWLLVESC